MENYRIYCHENERAEIMSILRKYNDVVIDGITIERDSPEALYQSLLEELDREVFRYRRDREDLERDRIYPAR